MFRRLLLSVSFALIGASPAGADEPAAPPPPATVEALQARLDELTSTKAIPGVGVVVYRDGQPAFLGGAGLADQASGRKVDADTHFRIGSISKTFLAIAILQQVERGRLKLDDEVAKLLPDIPIDNPWQATDPVRVVHLLEHSAGFDDMHFRNMNARPGEDTASEMRRFAHEFEVRWRPGERSSYSNPGYGLLGYLLEKVSGQEQEAYISEQVLKPLGMNATVWSREGIESSLALGYEAGKDQVLPWDDTAMPAVGALISTANDMARALEYFLSGGQSAPGVLSAESFARMERTETTLLAKAGVQVGYGAGNYFTERGGWALRGHSGGIPGYWANLQYQREAGFGYVVLFNVMESPAIRPLQLDLIGFASQGRQPPAPLAAAQADAQWNGWYHIDNPRNEFIGGFDRLANAGYIEARGDRYAFVHAVVPETMEQIALADGKLRDPEVHHANGVLTRDADGRRVFVTDDNVFEQGSWWSVALPQYAVVAALLLLLSALLLAPIWGVRALRGRLQGSPHWRDRLWPLAAALALFTTLYLPWGLAIGELTGGTATPRTLAIAAGGWLFALCAAIGLVQHLRHWRAPGNAVARWHGIATCAAGVGLAAWLYQVNLLGIRLWAW